MLSLIEFIVYGLICYSGIILLIISAFQNPSNTKSGGGARVIWLIPSMFAAFILMSVGGGIILDDGGTVVTTALSEYEVLDNTNTIQTLNSTVSETVVVPSNTITFIAPIWGTVHFLFFIVLLLYVLFNILGLFIKHE